MLLCRLYWIGVAVIFCTELASGQSVQRGGFIYGWSNYSADPDTGIGTRPVFWDSTDVVSIPHAPPPGIHPRIYFGPDEIASIRFRLDSTLSGQAALKVIRAYTTAMHLSPAAGVPGYYRALLAHDTTIWDGTNPRERTITASVLAMEAFLCLVYDGETDSTVGISYADRAEALADALHFWAKLALADPAVGPSGEKYRLFGGVHMAYCYDFNYYAMTQNQRDTIRMALAKIIPEIPRYGVGVNCYTTTSNWSALNGFEIIPNLAIEGEPGYKENLTKHWMRTMYNFIQYGWYPSGAGYEGLGKNGQWVTTLIACAKRGYGLLSHPHVRAYGTSFLPAIMQPFGHGFTTYDVWGGSGRDPVLGRNRFNASDAAGLKWAFPNNPAVDFVWRNYVEKAPEIPDTGYVYNQFNIDDGYSNFLLPAAIFARDYTPGSWEDQALAVVKEDYLASDRGLAVLRSGKGGSSLSVQFHARQDMGGHTHGDRLDFTLSGLGRMWVQKTYGGSPFQPSKYHSMVLIDGKGIGVGDPDGDKCRQPARILFHEWGDTLSTVSADATYAYTWEWHWSPQTPDKNHPWLGTNGWEAVTERWNDFQPTPVNEPLYDIPFYEYPHWSQPGKLERLVKRPYNPMQKVFRTIGMIKGSHPMVLIADELKKDESSHRYDWITQITNDLVVDTTVISLNPNNHRYDIILKEPEATGNRRLLVRILSMADMNPQLIPFRIDTLDYFDYFSGLPFSPNPNVVRQRLIITSQSVEPGFRILLYPFHSNDPLPHTAWNESHDTLHIELAGQNHLLHLHTENAGNIRIERLVSSPVSGLVSEPVEEIKLFPNPASSMLQLVLPRGFTKVGTISITDTQGRSLMNRELSDQIDVSALPPGQYFLNLHQGSQIYRTSFIRH